MAKIRKFYDLTIKPDGTRLAVYPITSTRAVYSPQNIKLETLLTNMQGTIDELLDIINGLADSGVALKQSFGLSRTFGISLKVITDAITAIWEELEEITSEQYLGINMDITPTYFVSDDSTTITISVSPINAVSFFDSIELYKNLETTPFASGTVVESPFTATTTISDTTTITCKAVVLGAEYITTLTIPHYNEFWIGGGQDAEDVKIVANAKEFNNGSIAGAYDVVVEEGDNIILVLGDAAAEMFVRADMNGIEIPMTQSSYTEGDNTYVVFTSNATFTAGTYNIDINS